MSTFFGQNFSISTSHKPSPGSCQLQQKCRPDRFSRFNIYSIQTDRQTDKQNICKGNWFQKKDYFRLKDFERMTDFVHVPNLIHFTCQLGEKLNTNHTLFSRSYKSLINTSNKMTKMSENPLSLRANFWRTEKPKSSFSMECFTLWYKNCAIVKHF